MTSFKLNAEFLVKYGLPLILLFLIVSIIASLIVVKFVLKRRYFELITRILIEWFHADLYEIVTLSRTTQRNSKSIEYSDRKQYVNIECYNITIDPTSRFIQLPYLVRFLSYILFWTYFIIQTLFLEETLSDVDLTDDGYKCTNVTVKFSGSLFKCEKYGLKTIDAIINNMDQIAGILTLNEINRFVFRASYRFFKWIIRRFFRSYFVTLSMASQKRNFKVPLVSYAQVNYFILVAYLSYAIYQNFSSDSRYVPIKFVCYSTLVYSTILSAYETVKYSIYINDLKHEKIPLLLDLDEDNNQPAAVTQLPGIENGFSNEAFKDESSVKDPTDENQLNPSSIDLDLTG